MNQHRWTCLTVFALSAMVAPIAAANAKVSPSPTANRESFRPQSWESLPTKQLTVAEPKTEIVIPVISQPVPQVSKLPIVNPTTTTKTKPATDRANLKLVPIDKLPAKQQSVPTFLATTPTFSSDLRVPNSVGMKVASQSIAAVTSPVAASVNPVAPLPQLENRTPQSLTSSQPTTFSSKTLGAPIPVARDTNAPIGKTKVPTPTEIVNSATVQAEIATPQPDSSRVSATMNAPQVGTDPDPQPQAAPVVRYRNDRAEIPSFEAGVPVFVFEDKQPSQIVATAIAQVGDTIVAPEPSIAIPVMRPAQSTIPARSLGASAPAGRPFANSSGTVEQSPTTVQPVLDRVVSTHTGKASWYGSEGGSKTANGERYDPRGLTAAHRTLPFGTKVRVTSIKTGKSTIVRINDRGPFRGNRAIDISAGAAEAIGIKNDGIGEVRIEVLADRV